MANLSTLTVNFCIADATGRILCSGSCSALALANQPLESGQLRYPYRANPGVHYINAGEVAARPEMAPVVSKWSLAADGIDSVSISGLPEGSEVRDAGEWEAATAGTYVFTAATPGMHRLGLRCWPYQDVTVTLKAV